MFSNPLIFQFLGFFIVLMKSMRKSLPMLTSSSVLSVFSFISFKDTGLIFKLLTHFELVLV